MMGLLGKATAMPVTTGGAKADFLAANALFAVFLLVFVGFFCIRMLSNTKIAAISTAWVSAVVCLHHLYQNDWDIPALSVFNGWIVLGAACCAAAAGGILLGLIHEEKEEEYVHRRRFWCGLVLLGYSGLVCISHGISL